MDNEQPLAFNDQQSDSDHSTLVCLALLESGPPEDAVEVHTQDSEVEVL